MKPTRTASILLSVILALCISLPVFGGRVWAGNKRMMSERAAMVLAQRALVETVYGLKLRSTEEVKDMVAASFVGRAETKTEGDIKGIQFEEVIYDAQQDIAKVTAAVALDRITNVNGDVVELGDKVYRRVAYATTTPSMAGPIRALRAAELDAYQQLIKRVMGFHLESQTTVENFMLTSDIVKTQVMATLYLAEVIEYGWQPNGDAFVKMTLQVGEVSDVLGNNVVGEGKVIEVVGQGAQQSDLK